MQTLHQGTDGTTEPTAAILKASRVFPKKPKGLRETGIVTLPSPPFSSSSGSLEASLQICSQRVRPGQLRRPEPQGAAPALGPRLADKVGSGDGPTDAEPVRRAHRDGDKETRKAAAVALGPFVCASFLSSSGVITLGLSLLADLCLVLEVFS